jgi:transposase-like protein
LNASSVTAACPHCSSTNTVRIGQLVGTWLHFCFACGKRFERKDDEREERS